MNVEFSPILNYLNLKEYYLSFSKGFISINCELWPEIIKNISFYWKKRKYKLQGVNSAKGFLISFSKLIWNFPFNFGFLKFTRFDFIFVKWVLLTTFGLQRNRWQGERKTDSGWRRIHSKKERIGENVNPRKQC